MRVSYSLEVDGWNLALTVLLHHTYVSIALRHSVTMSIVSLCAQESVKASTLRHVFHNGTRTSSLNLRLLIFR